MILPYFKCFFLFGEASENCKVIIMLFSFPIFRWDRGGTEPGGKLHLSMERGMRNKFAGLENLNAEADINRILETINENIKISAKDSLGYYELKKYKPWFGEGFSKLSDRRK